MRRLLAATALLATAPAAPLPAGPEACVMAPADRSWIDRAVASWRTSERVLLRLDPAPLPLIVAIDGACTFAGRAGPGGAIAWSGTPHDGKAAVLPDGNAVPIGPISFAAPGAGGFFAMSLPSVWARAGVTSGLGLERLMEGVLLHELMHTRQFYFADPALAEVQARHGLGEEAMHDDAVQERFAADPAYTAAFAAERDALFAAAAAPDDAAARRLAGEALAMMRARRARWFTGKDAHWAPLDEIFLTMEGLGQWLAYAWYVAPEGAGLTPAAVLPEVRRGGRRWSQDEGLALFLAVDRLVPGWQKLAFAARPLLAEALLARAAGER